MKGWFPASQGLTGSGFMQPFPKSEGMKLGGGGLMGSGAEQRLTQGRNSELPLTAGLQNSCSSLD